MTEAPKKDIDTDSENPERNTAMKEAFLIAEVNDLREKVIKSIEEGDFESAKLLRRDIAQHLDRDKESGAMSQKAINTFLKDWKDLMPAEDTDSKSKESDEVRGEEETHFEEKKKSSEVLAEREKSDKEKAERLSREIRESETFKESGVSLDELKKVEGFEVLSHGQRLLIAENLKQLTLGRVYEEASGKHKEITAKGGFLGRVWQSVSKKYQIAKLEKSTAEEIISGGMKVHSEALDQLIKRAGDGPDVEVSKDGRLEILYVSGMEDITPEQKESVENFNQVASNFSKMPEEWRYKTAGKKEQEEYKKLRRQYEKAKTGVLEIKSSEVGDQNATFHMNDIDARVYSDQFLNTHPDVEEQLQNITDKNVWMKAMANVVTERGIYSVAGFLTRSVTTSLIGLAGAPIAAAGMGGFLARKRAKEALVEHEIGARRGEIDKSKEAKNFVNADQLREKIERLSQKISTEGDADKREKLLVSLRARISYTQGKMEDGLVGYGKGAGKLASQYELTSSLGGAVADIEAGKAWKSALENRLEEFLDFKEQKISATQEKYVKDQMIRGAIMGAGFAVAGYALRHFGEGWFGWGGKTVEGSLEETQAPPLVDGQSDVMPGHTQSTNTGEVVPGQSQADMLDEQTAGMEEEGVARTGERVVESTGARGAIEHPVKSGDSVWGIIEDKLEAKRLFEGMEDGQRTRLINTFKDKITSMSSEELTKIGISSGDPDVLKVGDTLDLTSVLGDTEALQEAILGAETLTDAQIESIELNDVKIAEWADAHSGELIIESRIDEILSGVGVDTLSPEVLDMADNVMQSKIKNIYEHGFLFFKGSQIEEWTGGPADGVVGVKDMKVENIFKGDFGEPFGGGLDAAQENNRKQLLEFLNELKTEVKPVNGETIEEYIRRALAIQIIETQAPEDISTDVSDAVHVEVEETANKLQTEGLIEKEGQIQFLEAKITETNKLLDGYYDKYGDRDNYNAFKEKVMAVINDDKNIVQKIESGDKNAKLLITGNMSPEEFAKAVVENAEKQTNLTTTQEQMDSAFDEMSKS